MNRRPSYNRFPRNRTSEAELNEILNKHELWIQSNGKDGERAKLSQLNFKSFMRTRLDGKPGGGVRLQGAVLEKIHIEGCNLQGAYFQGANLDYAMIKESVLWHSRIKSAYLRHITINECDMQNAYLQNSNFEGSFLKDIILTSAYCVKTSFIKTKIYSSVFIQSSLKNAKFNKSEITGVDFSRAKLIGVNFENAKIDKTSFIESSLVKSNFRDTLISNTTFQNADLYSSDLTSCRLNKVNFCNANLKDSDLTNANLSDVDMTGACLENIIIDTSTRDSLPQFLIDKYGHTFKVRGLIKNLKTIRRSIHFKPEHRQAGIGILSYFSNILNKTYPDQDIRFRIEQNYPIVSLIIETPDGDLIEKIEKKLKQYGEMVTGCIPINEFTSDELLIIDIKNELRIAQLRIETQSELLAFKDKEIRRLFDLINRSLEKPAYGNISLAQSLNDNVTRMGDIQMGDNYQVGQAGSVGRSSSASNINFEQVWNQLSENVDLSTLAKELSTLRQAMKTESSAPAHDISIGNIANAEQAAIEGNGTKAIEYLRKSGKWSLDVAQKIGVGVAISAIKSSLGL